MKNQIPKFFAKDIGWLVIVVIIVTVVSFTLRMINNYFENGLNITLVQAATTDSVESVSLVKLQATPKALGVTTEKKPYQAELVWKTTSVINIAPGKRITFEAQFKNTGTETWRSSGDHFIALNVTNPPGRESVFRDIFWPKDYRPAVMKTEVVKPGEVGLFRFALTAPLQEEWYVEKFGLVAEHLIWIEGGDLEIAMKVGNPTPHFQAELVDQAFEEITIEPGKAITFWVDFKNTGSQTWYKNGEHFVALNVTDPVGRESPFRHDFWPLAYRPAKIKNEIVKPDEVARFEFALQAPENPDNYVEKFGLVAENLTWIKNGTFEIPINVKIEPEPVIETAGEPDIRVGLYPTSSKAKITGNGKYQVKDTENKLIGTYNKNIVSTVNYRNEKYTLSVNGETTVSDLPLRFIPKSNETILEITNFENRPEWNEETNDNRFRGILEVHYADDTEQLWVINELPLESYLRGVAEAGNDNDEDYLKALMIAARTYGMYHVQTNTKHDEENFTVDATYDQVYRGYEFELRSPNITQAILDTAGVMVTYEDEIAITPYFSQTDGRTRAWEEVWAGGPYPWLVSVPDPWCEGDILLGHGVGMSAKGARAQAEEGKTYEEILKYYYTGVEVNKIY